MLEGTLEALERRLDEGDDPQDWSALAAWVARTGQRPALLRRPGMARRVLARLKATPGERPLTWLLEAALPVRLLGGTGPGGDEDELAFDPEVGVPLRLALTLAGGDVAMAWTPSERGWVAESALTPDDLARALGRPSEQGTSPGDRRSLLWLDASDWAQTLTDRLVAEDLGDPSFQVRLPRSSKLPHRIEGLERRLVLAPARTLEPRPVQLRTERAYMGKDGAGFKRWLRFFEDGRVHFGIGHGRDRKAVEARILSGELVRRRGRYALEGRRLTGQVRAADGAFEYRGFVGDDGALRLECWSRITDHRSATVYRVW